MALIECVPNFSEGRNTAVVEAIAAAITAAHGRVLDWSCDAWHHRAVITFVADESDIVDAAFAAIRTARDLIDLRTHTGVHPRIGAADVVPFIPLEGVSMETCVERARLLAEQVGSELHIPVYLYEHAAQRAAYRNLADVRRGGTDALVRTIATTHTPDAGPHALHASAGAVAIGARHFLGAFNVFVGDETHLPAAKAIARELRASGGGLPGLKALGLVVDQQAQVSMNVTDLGTVSLHAAFDAVAAAATRHGTRATHSEIIGLVPQATIETAFADRIQLRDARETVSLEHRIAQTTRVDDLTRTAGAIAALHSPEASGTAAALAAVLASATTRLAAGVHVARARTPAAEHMRRVLDSAVMLERHLHVAARDDAEAWQAVLAARRLDAGTPDAFAHRVLRVDAALMGASEVPLRIARLACDALALAAEAAVEGDHVTAPDAWAGANIAHAAVHAALGLARGNLAMLADPSLAIAATDEARVLTTSAGHFLEQARIAVKHVAG
jgi:glutamate formiminotransferase / formiminotetrahydrofolate cyclodeaminase